MMHQTITGGDVARIPGLRGEYAVRLLRHKDLTAVDRARWADLSVQAGASNVFAQHWFMDAAWRHSRSAQRARLAVVSHGDGTWLGVLPLVPEPRFGRWPAGNWQTWSATNQFLGTPLVLPHAARAFWTALLNHLDGRAGGAMLIHCRLFASDDPICAALAECCEAEGRGFRLLDRFDRPARLPNGEVARSHGKVLARLHSLRQRLERDHGPVSVEIQAVDADCGAWIDQFLALEKSGWKGRAGSALASDPETERLFRDVILQGRDRGQVRLASLIAGGRRLAMSSWFETGDRGFGFKMAFDEAFRAYAPGRLLMHDVANRIGEHSAMHFDTCAPAAACSGQSPWDGKRTIFDCAVAIGPPLRRLLFDGLMQARDAYTAVMPGMKRMSGPLPTTFRRAGL